MIPAAVAKAKSLAAHARYLGIKPCEFAVLISVSEGFELIDWLLSDEGPADLERSVLEYDATVAKATNNPFVVLQNFELEGMKILRETEVLH